MKQILNEIDRYLEAKEKYDSIFLSSKWNGDLSDAIEMIRKSSDKEKTISMFNEDIKQQIRELMEGGIL